MRQAAAQHRSGVRPQAGCAPPYRSTPRARTRPASVIDRLLKNQNPFENSNNLRSSSPHLVVPGNRRNFAVRNSSTPEAIAVPIADVRFGHSMTRRRDGRRPPPSEDPPRRVTRWLAASTIAPPAPALSSVGDDFRPHHVILDRKVAARLFRRFPRPVEARILPDSYVSSMGSAFMETA